MDHMYDMVHTIFQLIWPSLEYYFSVRFAWKITLWSNIFQSSAKKCLHKSLPFLVNTHFMTIASISGLQKNRAVQLVDSQLENNDSRHKYFDILYLCSSINKTTSLKTSKFRQNVIKSLAQRRRLTDFFFQVVKMRSSSVFFYFPIELIQNLMRVKI